MENRPWTPALNTQDRSKSMDKVTYIIWKRVEDRNVREVEDVVGLFTGTCEEADAVLADLNAREKGPKNHRNEPLYPYRRSEPDVITKGNLWKFHDGE